MNDAAGSIGAPGTANLRRIGVAVMLSAALHVAFVVLVRVAAPRHQAHAGAIEARLTPIAATPAPVPVVAPPMPAAIDAPPVAPLIAAAPSSLGANAPLTAESVPARERPRDTPASATTRPADAPPIEPVQPSEVPAATQTESRSVGPALEVPLIEDPEFYPARKLDVLPRPLAEVPLRYPPDAAARDVSGRVVLLLLIDELGMVTEASVISAEPPGVFEDAALESFRHVQFSPAQRNGRVVKSRLPVEVTFDPKVESLKR